ADLADAPDRVVQHVWQIVAEILRDSSREHRADAVDFGGQVAFERKHSGGPDGLEIGDAKLFAEARMLFEAAARADARADFEPREISNYRDGPGVAAPRVGLDNRNGVSALIVDVEDVIEGALDHRLAIFHLGHLARITRQRSGVKCPRGMCQQGGAGPCEVSPRSATSGCEARSGCCRDSSRKSFGMTHIVTTED